MPCLRVWLWVTGQQRSTWQHVVVPQDVTMAADTLCVTARATVWLMWAHHRRTHPQAAHLLSLNMLLILSSRSNTAAHSRSSIS